VKSTWGSSDGKGNSLSVIMGDLVYTLILENLNNNVNYFQLTFWAFILQYYDYQKIVAVHFKLS